jgi:NADP-dependent 3-hydroxy acid dehydrogenase YdfG
MPQLIWLITGCSSGFGEQFVESILARGDKVIATARTLSKIKHLEKPGVSLLHLDLTDSQKILHETMSKAIEIYGKIDVLINNAAYVGAGFWEDVE